MNFELENFKSAEHPTIKAFFNLKLVDAGLTIKECRLMLNNKGEHFLAFPSKKNGDSWVNLVTISNAELQNDVVAAAKGYLQ